ncbi:S8 family peptidase [Salipaludibacillus agaradhaerens]|uniref:S8 family peptidase n=1 Tax=Salipaludibacillus agaradhaerens TaxID=76935 RepID=UPI000998357D|nr:S8 family serine peptidase [Salipaludibacillus agaradhaerens]
MLTIKSILLFIHIFIMFHILSGSEYLLKPIISNYEINKSIPHKIYEKQYTGWGVTVLAPKKVAIQREVKLAIIDSGIDKNHPDLQDVVIAEKNVIYPDRDISDDTGHGTGIAGIIAANDNSFGISGVSSSIPLKIYSIKAFENDKSKDDYILEALTWAIEENVDLINMSLGSQSSDQRVEKLLDKAYSKNIIIVAAAGNNLNGKVDFPASNQNVISVGAINSDFSKVPFTSYGKIDFVGPGENILTTFPNNKYGYISHTSAATAFVSGAVANYISQFESKEEYTVKEVRKKLENNAINLGNPELFGKGLIQN